MKKLLGLAALLVFVLALTASCDTSVKTGSGGGSSTATANSSSGAGHSGSTGAGTYVCHGNVSTLPPCKIELDTVKNSRQGCTVDGCPSGSVCCLNGCFANNKCDMYPYGSERRGECMEGSVACVEPCACAPGGVVAREAPDGGPFGAGGGSAGASSGGGSF